MKALILKHKTWMRDIHGQPVGTGGEYELDPALAHGWAGVGLVRITEHDRPGTDRCVVKESTPQRKPKPKDDDE